ncbi:hypothetical protein [Anaerocolumna aminovalerica]|nr:hypothetical protein [Anaerocolumna aminovalerica]
MLWQTGLMQAKRDESLTVEDAFRTKPARQAFADIHKDYGI